MNDPEPSLRKDAAPSVPELQTDACEIIARIMAGGKAKHGEAVWFHRETVRHHADRVQRHVGTAMMIRDGNEPIRDGEDEVAHLERAFVRCLFALQKVKRGHS